MTPPPPCPFCGKTSTFALSGWEVTNLENGALIHDVLPHFTRETREQMISGIDPNCWAQVLGS